MEASESNFSGQFPVKLEGCPLANTDITEMDESTLTNRQAVLVYLDGARDALRSAQFNLDGGFYGVGKIFQQCYDIIDRSNPDLIFADKGLTERVWFVFQNGCDIIIDRVKYIFQYLGANNTDLHTLSWYGNVANPDFSLPPGISHPPGQYLILAAIGFLGMLISSDLALGWGIIITILNTLLIPVIIIISKEAFSERIGKFTGIMLLTIPSVCMHFCGMFDVLLSVFTALGALFLIYGLKHFWDDQPEGKPKHSKGLLYGLGCGTFFTLAAQGTYGHAIPILAFLLSFLFFAKKRRTKEIWGSCCRNFNTCNYIFCI